MSHAIRLPSLLRSACIASLPGYRQAHIATSAIKPPLHSTAFGLPVVNQSTATLELIVTKHKVFELSREDTFACPSFKEWPKQFVIHYPVVHTIA